MHRISDLFPRSLIRRLPPVGFAPRSGPRPIIMIESISRDFFPFKGLFPFLVAPVAESSDWSTRPPEPTGSTTGASLHAPDALRRCRTARGGGGLAAPVIGRLRKVGGFRCQRPDRKNDTIGAVFRPGDSGVNSS